MSRVCTICKHPKRNDIDKALVGNESVRDIAGRYAVSRSSVFRHKDEHLPKRLTKAKAIQDLAAEQERQALAEERHVSEQESVDDLAGTLKKVMQRVTLLFDACDRWLRDADNSEQYDIGPRAEDLNVTYETWMGDRRVRRKERLSVLLPRVEEERGITIVAVESKHADPRHLVLQASGKLGEHLELLAKLLGKLDEKQTVNILVSPDWIRTRNTMMAVLMDFPEARIKIADALMQLGEAHGNGI